MRVDVFNNPGRWAFGLIALWLATLLCGLQTYDFWNIKLSLWRSGIDVQGTITDRQAYSPPFSFSIYQVEYSYPISDSDNDSVQLKHVEKVRKELYDSLQIGSLEQVRVNPENPRQSWLQGNYSSFAQPTLFFLGLLLAGIIQTVMFVYHFNITFEIKRRFRKLVGIFSKNT